MVAQNPQVEMLKVVVKSMVASLKLPKTRIDWDKFCPGNNRKKYSPYRDFDRSDLWLVVKPLEDQIDFQ